MAETIAANASATRAFFVDMLVRDIGVDGAILDLVDNSIDAAVAHSSQREGLGLFWVEVVFNSDYFEIRDNCGGIDVETARNYAFRFGRAREFNPKSKIGEFGIGMKRAVFRLGRKFLVESSTTDASFSVDVDVATWREQRGEWTFPMVVSDPLGDSGTRVKVTELNQGVAELLDGEEYSNRMLQEIAEAHSEALRLGMQLTVNKIPADARLHEVLNGAGIAPENQTIELVSGDHPVKLRIVAGIGPDRRSRSESGWYIYCNGRLVLKADRTPLTGWGTGGTGQSDGIPAWHPQYARFRGFVFFESEHPAALPWTTTKTEIDEFSPVYQNALGRMRTVIRRFTSFTNELDQERERYQESEGDAPQVIQEAIGKAELVAVNDLPEGEFAVPERGRIKRTPSGPKMTRVLFHAQADQVGELKAAFGLTTNRAVGELAFERLYEEEIA
ncbi:MAG: hypothetical protein F4X41_00410 [Chloroflexi bacterium]|nr:hypothetical protein [Chloroflexota bacterium]